MFVHKGIRPQDIVILSKISSLKDQPWMMKDIAIGLDISPSEVSESLNRSVYARLISSDKKKVYKEAFMEFLVHGLKYVFPQHPGGEKRGVPTAYSAFPLNQEIISEKKIVWPSANGTERGFAIEPLYRSVPEVCLKDEKLYEILSLIDALRIGSKREINLAIKLLEERL